MTESTTNPLSGLWKPTQLQQMFYGPNCVQKHLLSALPTPTSKALILTGSSLASKTSLIKQIESLLTPTHHARTISSIKQHAPVAQLDEATAEIANGDSTIDTIISVGGGSPIDSAKAISHRHHAKTGKFLHHIAVPTTLSAAECSSMAGYTQSDGVKTGVADPALAPHAIFYDATFARETPAALFLSTGVRALDHAVEMMYHPTASEIPTRGGCVTAAWRLFTYLPKYRDHPRDEEVITQLQLAAFGSLGFYGLNGKGGLGLSHALGYALGSPYGIPHGVTSCMTLGKVVKLMAERPEAASQIARILPHIGYPRTGDDRADAVRVGEEIERLVGELGVAKTLGDYSVGRDQVPVITRRATKMEEGELYDKVAQLVESLY